VIARYYYDPFGRRLWKEVGGARTYFHYSDEGLVGEYDSAGVETKVYGWRPGSTWSTDPVFMKVGNQYCWYHNDHLGTPQKLTTSSGAVVWSAKYSSFLEATVDASSTIMNNLRAPGQYFDIETGLYYNFNRYYDTKLGRYNRIDPIGIVAARNHYWYSDCNPLKNIDPEGLQTKKRNEKKYNECVEEAEKKCEDDLRKTCMDNTTIVNCQDPPKCKAQKKRYCGKMVLSCKENAKIACDCIASGKKGAFSLKMSIMFNCPATSMTVDDWLKCSKKILQEKCR
jgi:RHS repeat-associated protein